MFLKKTPSILAQISWSVLFLLIVAGCGGSTKVKKSGFLGDYSQFKSSPQDEEALLYVHPTKTIADYDKLMFDHPIVYFHPDAKGKGINPEKLKELTDFWLDEAVKAVEGAYEVVEKPGPGVLRVRAAITEVNTSDPKKNIVTQYVVKMSVDVGGASMEAELVDSQTGERIVGYMASRKGRAFVNYKNLITQYGDTKGALKYWAQNLRERLDEMHGKTEEK